VKKQREQSITYLSKQRAYNFCNVIVSLVSLKAERNMDRKEKYYKLSINT